MPGTWMKAAPSLRWAPSIAAAAGAATLLTLCISLRQVASSTPLWRLEVAGGAAAMLLLLSATPLIVAPFTNKWLRDPIWETAATLTAAIAAAGLTIVGLYGLF